MKKIIFILILVLFSSFLYCENNSDLNLEKLIKSKSYNWEKDFSTFLKLRDIADARAIPIFEKLLNKHIGTGNIYAFAAAQGLFYIGNEESYKILDKYLFSDMYDTGMGIRYVFHWDMKESLRNAFISRYHLKNTKKDIIVQLNAKSVITNNKQLINFIITIKNVSPKSIYMYNPKHYIGKMLLLYSEDRGVFANKQLTVDYDFDDLNPFIEIQPNESVEYKVTAKPVRLSSDMCKVFRVNSKNNMVLDCGDIFHTIGIQGKYKVYAIYSISKRFAKYPRNNIKNEIWSGTIISEPININISPINN